MICKIINYKTGNIYSVISALDNLGLKSIVISCANDLNVNDTVILPGVGSFDTAASNLSNGGFYEHDFVGNRNKVIGICLGFHLMCLDSEEGNLSGLELLPVHVKDLKGCVEPTLHLGWSYVSSNVDAFRGKHYFCHRFYVGENDYSLAFTNRSGNSVSNVIRKDNFWGIQSHPERSGTKGLALLKEILQIES